MLVVPLMSFRTRWQLVVGTQNPVLFRAMICSEQKETRNTTMNKNTVSYLYLYPLIAVLHMRGWEKLRGKEMTSLHSSPFVLCYLLSPLLWCPLGIPCGKIIALGRSKKYYEHICCLYYVKLNKEHFNIKLFLNSHIITNVKLQKLINSKVEKV